ncbi:MAG: glyoxalase [Acidobacteria bacterium]|nr:MAG: glyoxalase [Acidobacteriota bacterium]
MLSRALRSLSLAVALCVTGAAAARPQTNALPPVSAAGGKIHIRAVGPIAITVEDMDRSVDFYTHVLTFEKISDTEVAGDEVEHLFGVFGSRVRIVTLKLGSESIELLQFLAPKGRPIPVDSRSNDVDPKWQHTGDRLFLGIDHTAIVVSDTDASLRFYHDLLGLRIAGASENYGTEQEHLNNVFGARLRITASCAPSGPGIGLLEDLSPRDGRAIPVDEHANDLVHRETQLETENPDAATEPLRMAKTNFISDGLVSFHGPRLGFTRGFVVRDPDGHAISIVQR